MDTLSKAMELFSFIFNGMEYFIDFILGLPSFIYSLIEVIPNPLYNVLMTFVSIIIFVIMLIILGKVVSSVK